MGIKNLMQLIKKSHKDCVITLPLQQLSGNTICIDTPCVMYKYKYTNFSDNKNNWVNSLLYFLIKMIEFNIDCCFVLEGIAPPQKNATRTNRIKVRENVIIRSDKLEALYETFKINNTVSEELNKEWKALKQTGDFNGEIFEKILKKREIYTQNVTKADYDILSEILESFNIPTIQSETEAETLCSFLQKTNKTDYIFSCDSDVLAYNGVSGFISEIDLKNNSFTFIDKTKLLNRLELDSAAFIDFCILCGTDYNDTLNKIGIVSAQKLIRKHSSINNLNLCEEDIKKINVTWIREKFNLKEFSDEIGIYFKWPILNHDSLYKCIEKHNIQVYCYISKLLKKINNIWDDEE